MNITALKSAFNSLSFHARIFAAMRKTAILKHSVAHVNNRKNKPCLAVRYNDKLGFVYTDKNGNNIPKSTINNLLRAA